MCLPAIVLRDRPANELLAMGFTCEGSVACDVSGRTKRKGMVYKRRCFYMYASAMPMNWVGEKLILETPLATNGNSIGILFLAMKHKYGVHKQPTRKY